MSIRKVDKQMKANDKTDISSFRLVVGDSPFIRVLDFLLDTRESYDYSLTEIAEKSGVS